MTLTLNRRPVLALRVYSYLPVEGRVSPRHISLRDASGFPSHRRPPRRLSARPTETIRQPSPPSKAGLRVGVGAQASTVLGSRTPLRLFYPAEPEHEGEDEDAGIDTPGRGSRSRPRVLGFRIPTRHSMCDVRCAIRMVHR